MSMFQFMQFASFNEQMKEIKKNEKIEELNQRKFFMSDYEYEEELRKIEESSTYEW